MVYNVPAGVICEAWCSATHSLLNYYWSRVNVCSFMCEAQAFVQFWAYFSQIFQLITPNVPSCRRQEKLHFSYSDVMPGFAGFSSHAAERREVWIAHLWQTLCLCSFLLIESYRKWELGRQASPLCSFDAYDIG